jgi:hypothetical protein
VQTKTKQTIYIAVGLTLALTGAALAQDAIGVQPVSTSAIASMKLIAAAGIGWGFLRLMSGRHTIEGLTLVGVGGLGLAKTQAVVGLLGLG